LEDVLREFTLKDDYESIRMIVNNKNSSQEGNIKYGTSRQGVAAASGR